MLARRVANRSADHSTTLLVIARGSYLASNYWDIALIHVLSDRNSLVSLAKVRELRAVFLHHGDIVKFLSRIIFLLAFDYSIREKDCVKTAEAPNSHASFMLVDIYDCSLFLVPLIR